MGDGGWQRDMTSPFLLPHRLHRDCPEAASWSVFVDNVMEMETIDRDPQPATRCGSQAYRRSVWHRRLDGPGKSLQHLRGKRGKHCCFYRAQTDINMASILPLKD